LNGGQEQRDQNSDDRDHHKQLDQRESRSDNTNTTVLEKETSETGNMSVKNVSELGNSDRKARHELDNPGNMLLNKKGNTPNNRAGNKARKNRDKKAGNHSENTADMPYCVPPPPDLF
jgi:hypothetical protein